VVTTMALDHEATIARIVGHLRAGHVQQADDLATEALAAIGNERLAASGQPLPKPAPRSMEDVLVAALQAIAAALGNPAALEALVQELIAALEAKAS